MRAIHRVSAIAVVLGMLASGAARAAEITVLSTGAFRSVTENLARSFQASTGHRVIVRGDTAGGLQRRVEGGEAFDVLVNTPGALAALGRQGRVAGGAPIALARVGIGLGVRRGAPVPDISTTEAFRALMLSTRSFAIVDPASGGSSGIYLTQLFERWGIGPQMAVKAVLVPGGYAAARIVSGEAEIAMQQISEILAVEGVALVGPLPAEIQNFTIYAGILAPSPGEPAVARAFLDLLASAEAKPVIEAAGMLQGAP